eukprot:scaffold62063_cov65-Phaeocystis_antarctica.AAC.1
MQQTHCDLSDEIASSRHSAITHAGRSSHHTPPPPPPPPPGSGSAVAAAATVSSPSSLYNPGRQPEPPTPPPAAASARRTAAALLSRSKRAARVRAAGVTCVDSRSKARSSDRGGSESWSSPLAAQPGSARTAGHESR